MTYSGLLDQWRCDNLWRQRYKGGMLCIAAKDETDISKINDATVGMGDGGVVESDWLHLCRQVGGDQMECMLN